MGNAINYQSLKKFAKASEKIKKFQIEVYLKYLGPPGAYSNEQRL